MTTEEKNACKQECERELCDKFVLIPKNKLYYIIGGALAVIVVATGLSLASVFAYLRSEPTEIARKRIEKIREEAETQLKQLQAGDNYIHYGSQLALECDRHPGLHLHAYSDQHVTVERNALNSPFVRWTVQRVPPK